MINKNKKNTKSRLYRNTVVWIPEYYGTADEEFWTEQQHHNMLGTSLQARSVDHINVITVDTYLSQLHSMDKRSSYLDSLATCLARSEVQLLLCSAATYSDRLATACANKLIAVLPMASDELKAAALLTGAIPVEEIEECELTSGGCVGYNEVMLRYVMDLPYLKSQEGARVTKLGKQSSSGVSHSEDDGTLKVGFDL